MNSETELKDTNDPRYVRWQAISMAQFTVAIALLSALSVSAIGAGITLLQQPPFSQAGTHSLAFAISMLLFVLTILLTVLSTISRALDFRMTSRKVRGRVDCTIFGLDKDQFGKLSWGLFWAATLAFLAGGVLLVLSICTVYLQQFCAGG